MSAARCYRVKVPDSGLVLGTVNRERFMGKNGWEEGWRFHPWFQAHASRKHWPTPEAALAGRVKTYELEEVAR